LHTHQRGTVPVPHRLHEWFGSRLCDCAKIVDKISLGHTDTRVADGEDAAVLVGRDADVEVVFSVSSLGWKSKVSVAMVGEEFRVRTRSF
jgi:hypothetical protein